MYEKAVKTGNVILCDKASYEKGANMKLLSIGIILLSIGLTAQKAMSMVECTLTPAHAKSIDDYSGERLNHLGLAIKGKSIAAINVVLKNNKSLIFQEVEERTEMFPLEFAFFLHGYDEDFMLKVIAIMKEAGVEINQYKNFSALHYAAGHGHLKLFKYLLEACMNIDFSTVDNASVIHCAVGMYPDMQGQDAALSNSKLNSPGTRKLLRSNSSLKRILATNRIDNENPDRSESMVMPQIESLSKILHRLEILKILLVDRQAVYNQDKFEKMPQDYAINDMLKVFLDGISGNSETDIMLYERVRNDLAETCLSPRSPRLPQSPGRSGLGAVS